MAKYDGVKFRVLVAVILATSVLAMGCDALVDDNASGRVQILPGQSAEFEKWFVSLDGGYWEGGDLVVNITIINGGSRRSKLGGYWFQLVAIDSTGGLAEAEGTTPWGHPFIDDEFYPKQKWSGSIRYQMSSFSGETKLYATRFYHVRKYFLFYLGSPSSGYGDNTK